MSTTAEKAYSLVNQLFGKSPQQQESILRDAIRDAYDQGAAAHIVRNIDQDKYSYLPEQQRRKMRHRMAHKILMGLGKAENEKNIDEVLVVLEEYLEPV